jgi:uncharacterized protein
MHGGTVDFEFDPAKSAANRQKHGIDFVVAQALWSDGGLVVLPSKHPDEPRLLAIGRIDDKHWTAIFTERADAVRLISVRRARQDEKGIYEQNQSRES